MDESKTNVSDIKKATTKTTQAKTATAKNKPVRKKTTASKSTKSKTKTTKAKKTSADVVVYEQDSSAGESIQSYITMEQRQIMIETAAYFRAESRGFAEGNPEEDWLTAEADIDTQIANNQIM